MMVGDEEGSIDQEFPGENMDGQQNDSSTSEDIQLRVTSASLADEQLVMNNPHLRKLLNKMLDERIQQAQTRGESSTSHLLSTDVAVTAGQPKTQKGKMNKMNDKVIKSPSDTIIYVPALHRIYTKDLGLDHNAGKHNVNPNGNDSGGEFNSSLQAEMIKKNSGFVDQIRIEQQGEASGHQDQDQGQQGSQPQPRSTAIAPGYEEAQRRSDQAVIQAEKFRATVERPPGMDFLSHNFQNEPIASNLITTPPIPPIQTTQQVLMQSGAPVGQNIVGQGLSDDDFFH